MKFFVYTFLFVILNQACSESNIDIDFVAELIQKKSLDEKSFVEDVFEETVLKTCDHKCSDNCKLFFLLLFKNYQFVFFCV
jgi:hypothetical protein